MAESDIEKGITNHTRARGCKALKLGAEGENHWSDRLILCPNAFAFFLEVKKPGEPLRPGQGELRKRVLEPLGFDVFTVDTIEGYKVILDKMLKKSKNRKLYSNGKLGSYWPEEVNKLI